MRIGARLRFSLCASVTVAVLFTGLPASGASARSGSVRAAATGQSLQIPDTACPIPAGALFVAPTGNDASPGTQQLPLRTVARAVAVAPSGATIVLRAGVYRETFGNVVRPVTIQPYPHEQAWLSGSDVVNTWEPATSGWEHHGWTAQFCHSCYAPDAIDAKHPYAGWPDQLFFDGVPLAQVASLDN